MYDNLLLSDRAQKNIQKFTTKPSHAVLITGQRGIGLSSIAKSLSSQLLHDDTRKELENEQYFRLLQPKNGTIPIETVRSLQNFFALTVPGKRTVKRVVMIDDAEALSTEAQNSLLKTLEEPPEGSVLILVSSEPKRLLATIHSRLSSLNVTPPTKAEVGEWFKKKGFERTAIERAYLVADGSLAKIASMLENESVSDFETVRSVLGAKTFERLLYVDGMSKDKEAAQLFVGQLAQVASASLERSAATNPTSLERWQHVLAASISAQEALDRNGNTKLVLTDLMLSL
jgi:DNA polymerase-3 subunit delta'